MHASIMPIPRADRMRPAGQISCLEMMGDGAEEQNSESAVILRSASRTMRWMRISTRQSQRRNPDFRVRKGWVLSEPIYAPSPAREKNTPRPWLRARDRSPRRAPKRNEDGTARKPQSHRPERYFIRLPRKKPLFVVFCLILAVSPCSEMFSSTGCLLCVVSLATS